MNVQQSTREQLPSVVRRRAPDLAARLAGAATIEPVPGIPTTGFNGHGSVVMATPRVFAIYWGRDYGSPTTGMNSRASRLDSFFATVMTSRYVDMLSWYGVNEGSFLGSTWLDHSPQRAQTYTMDGMAKLLSTWLDAGLTPEVPDDAERNLLFFIFPPAEVTLTDNSGGGGFCAYHWRGHYQQIVESQPYNLIFAVADTTTDTDGVSHELAEAFTDPTFDGWYSDDGSHPEIGDVCSLCGAQTLDLAGFPVASYWLANADRCLQQSDLTGPLPAVVPDVVGDPVTEARSAIVATGLTYHELATVDNTCEKIGRVVSQSPAGGAELPAGAPVTIWVGVRPPHPCP